MRNEGQDPVEESDEVEDFHEEESKGLLPVLYLSSDWQGSPSDAQARPLKRYLRHPGEQCACAGWGPATIRWSGR